MIRRWVSAALLVRDGFSGGVFTSGAPFACALDGLPVRPVWKAGGYLVLTELAPGEHTLTIRRPGYQPETCVFRAEEGVVHEDTVFLKPGPGYPFPAEAAALELTLLEGARAFSGPVWLGMSGPVQLKLAQDDGAGPELRLFCRNPGALPVPGTFLLPGRQGGELARLRALEGETGRLDQPLAHRHARGTELIPVQRYRADEDGTLRAIFPRAGTVWLYCQGAVRSQELVPGTQRLAWTWKERD